ncbi:hypothetical protein H2199_003575 [Coniosporium tulheliwenetii]|uniref:Uncharacterized protein n=1 Tax=Coniosporium tulheliwenetii TaxID=3383036 RepID=A0ACC2ZBG4_9PEZI|nr:hypothetical protein H2199_003575 [Cladosporium sp. JES 115]
MRRGSSSRDETTTTATDPTPTVAEEPVAAAVPDPEPIVTTTTTTTAIVPVIVPTSTGPMVIDNMPVTSTTSGAYFRSALQQERARALFAKYGLTLEDHEWITTGSSAVNSERVEKPIRMRVRRQCHRCQANFGHDKVCVKCEHKRCKKCPSYPARKVVAALEDKGKGVARKDEDVVPALAPIPAPVPVPILLPTPVAVPAPEISYANMSHNESVEPATNARHCLFLPPRPFVLAASTFAASNVPETRRSRKSILMGILAMHQQRRNQKSNNPYARSVHGKSPGNAFGGHVINARPSSWKVARPKKVKKEFDPEVVKSLEEKLARLKMPESRPATAAAA